MRLGWVGALERRLRRLGLFNDAKQEVHETQDLRYALRRNIGH